MYSLQERSLKFKNNLTIHKVSSVLLFTLFCSRLQLLFLYYNIILFRYSNTQVEALLPICKYVSLFKKCFKNTAGYVLVVQRTCKSLYYIIMHL